MNAIPYSADTNGYVPHIYFMHWYLEVHAVYH